MFDYKDLEDFILGSMNNRIIKIQ